MPANCPYLDLPPPKKKGGGGANNLTMCPYFCKKSVVIYLGNSGMSQILKVLFPFLNPNPIGLFWGLESIGGGGGGCFGPPSDLGN